GLVRVVNRGVAAVFSWGVAPDYLVALQVTGHRSGRTISLPLAIVIVDGERYVVSNLGADVAWVRNVKAAGGRAVLRHGRTEPVHLEELAVERRAPIFKNHLRLAPGARPHNPAHKNAPPQECAARAARGPAF